MEAYLRKLADSPLGSYLAFPNELEFIKCSQERHKSFLGSECLRSLHRADGMLGQLLELNEHFDVDLAWVGREMVGNITREAKRRAVSVRVSVH
mmetsp:Transcript_14032/g.28794  ORF Transcript_14032/g.28794 Transcript_14032/m.28794 type:complete len:94 (+) Transcript_14032:258-539(+)